MERAGQSIAHAPGPLLAWWLAVRPWSFTISLAPVLAGTVTTLAVFIPVIFLSGMVQSLFEPLSIGPVRAPAASSR